MDGLVGCVNDSVLSSAMMSSFLGSVTMCSFLGSAMMCSFLGSVKFRQRELQISMVSAGIVTFLFLGNSLVELPKPLQIVVVS